MSFKRRLAPAIVAAALALGSTGAVLAQQAKPGPGPGPGMGPGMMGGAGPGGQGYGPGRWWTVRAAKATGRG